MMTKDEFYNQLTKVNASRESRLKCAQLVKNDMGTYPHLIDFLFHVEDKISRQAAWVLEFVCVENLSAIINHLDTFTKNLYTIHLDATRRAVSKICAFIAHAYYSKDNNPFKTLLKPEHIERIVEACFDWMINNYKVATKVFAMETLFLFGQDKPWVHDDLKQILQQDFPSQSAAFKSRAKHILHRMKKKHPI